MEERICTNCQKHYKVRRLIDKIKFCSNICRNEYLKKTSKKYQIKICPGCDKEFEKSYNVFCSRSCAVHFYNERRYGPKKIKLSRKDKRELLLSITPFCDLGETHKREIVMKEQLNCCAECGIQEWRGNPITLELDHKDGNNTNWSRDNLFFLCPNCHSQTSTWRGRNKRGSTNKIATEEGTSLRQVLIKRGLTPKGGNYRVLKRQLGLIT